MLTKLRLDILKDPGFAANMANRVLRASIGFVPAAMHVFEPRTAIQARLGQSTIMKECYRPSADWSRPELELFGAFVSARNHCIF